MLCILLWSYLRLQLGANLVKIDRQLNADPSQTGALCQGYAISEDDNASGSVYANAVSIRWQSTDFVSAPVTTTSTTMPTAAAATTNSKTASISLSEVPVNTHSGLTTGAKAGIGVGVTLEFFYFQRKRHESLLRDLDEAENMTGVDSTSKPKVMTEVSAGPDQQLAELPTPTYFITELPAIDFSSQEPQPIELDGHIER